MDERVRTFNPEDMSGVSSGHIYIDDDGFMFSDELRVSVAASANGGSATLVKPNVTIMSNQSSNGITAVPVMVKTMSNGYFNAYIKIDSGNIMLVNPSATNFVASAYYVVIPKFYVGHLYK